ncbi:hypothetical protein [Comamonas koreensis]|uniref:RNA polymerase alpha subunit C-terminal domain-containing protein n=1 Tax=Comamonas koreensis TaxID=160825 RepID=A0AAW4XUH0_9BURK|nr:hypothetical protein [Comamonas koreensis]MCD2165056.1 hypothetical protein [Comamonas koreensis]
MRNGLDTEDAVRKAYPLGLLAIKGIGLMRLRKIEKAFFPGQSYVPSHAMPDLPFVSGSCLNGSLPVAIVRALARGDITTPEQLREAYPHELLKIRSLGEGSLREIERVFFPGQRYEPPGNGKIR